MRALFFTECTDKILTMPCYLTPEQDDFNKIRELQGYIAEALYDVDSIVADPGAYTKDRKFQCVGVIGRESE